MQTSDENKESTNFGITYGSDTKFPQANIMKIIWQTNYLLLMRSWDLKYLVHFYIIQILIHIRMFVMDEEIYFSFQQCSA